MKRKKAGTTCCYEAQRSANNGLCCHISREESTEISFFEISFLTSNTVRYRRGLCPDRPPMGARVPDPGVGLGLSVILSPVFKSGLLCLSFGVPLTDASFSGQPLHSSLRELDLLLLRGATRKPSVVRSLR